MRILFSLLFTLSCLLPAGQAFAVESTSKAGAYVALGDSVASGAGLTPVISGRDPTCDVSSSAYPARVAASLKKPYQNFACRGATAGDLFNEQHLKNTTRDIEPQLDIAFASGTPSLITITAGANDVYWQSFARKCYVSTCGTSVDKASTVGLVTALRIKLEIVLTSINYRSNYKPPRVVLTGYYKPLTTKCTIEPNKVTSAEIAWFNNEIDALNRAISRTASYYKFARYAPISFSGHDLCSSSPWVQGLKDKAPFHPTATGQQKIADAVLRYAR